MRTRNAVAALAVVSALGGGLATGGVAAAATTLHATLSGQSEVPKAGNGSGSATLTLNAKKGRICFNITLKNVGTTMAGHIHKGGKSTAGPVFVPLFSQPTKHPQGCVSAPKADIRAIRKHPGRYYVNVHTAAHPNGAARGQLH
jgi:hypothetical protein